jgi:hypothetical protein
MHALSAETATATAWAVTGYRRNHRHFHVIKHPYG